ncbi:hypothetical protein, partial [Variovorax sp. CF079]|uniref:hypothetical protein n=1 Tax=Variovorax sp. CF079 TaxID=1882774 RepID=UPI001BAFE55F
MKAWVEDQLMAACRLSRRRPADGQYACRLDSKGAVEEAWAPYDKVTMAAQGVRHDILWREVGGYRELNPEL